MQKLKRILAAFLVVCMVIPSVPIYVDAATVPTYYDAYTLRDEHSDVSDWSSCCYVCCAAMMLTTKGAKNATPYHIWLSNGEDANTSWTNIEKNYGVTVSSGNLSGTAAEIKSKIISLCKSYPEGVFLSGTTNDGVHHAVVAYLNANGEILIHDPGYYNWKGRTVGGTSKNYSSYTQFTKYRVFKGTPTGWNNPPSEDGTVPITFNSIWANEITNTSAHVQADVTATASSLKEVGVKWGFSSAMVNTPLKDSVGSTLTKIYYDFGNGDYPSLLSGTTYYYQFYAIDSNNSVYTSKTGNFTTTGSAQKSTFSFNANGGSGTMASISVPVNGSATLAANSFTRDGYNFTGWNVKRGDGKWYTSGGWQTDSAIKSGGYTKKLYADKYALSYDQSWYRDLSAFQNYTFYAVWEEIPVQEYTVRYYENISGKNYVYDSLFTEGLNSNYYFSRDTDIYTLSIEENTGYGPCLKVYCQGEGESGSDITIRTTTQPGTNGSFIGDEREFTLSFSAMASEPDVSMYVRWGYQPVAEYQIVDLEEDWKTYEIQMPKTPSFGTDLHIYFDSTAGSKIWLNRIQVEEGTKSTAYVNETGDSGEFIFVAGEKLGDVLPELYRPGYNFEGWYTQNQGGSQVTESYIGPDGGFNIYAHWSVSDESLAEIASGTVVNNVKWRLTADGTLTISGTGDMPDYNYYDETPWYLYADSITRIIVDSGVSAIGDWSLTGLPNVTYLSIADSVTSIGDYALSDLTVKTVELPDALTYLGEAALRGTQISSIDIPSTLTEISPYVFAETQLTSVTIPASITKIGDAAFYGTKLTSITIPASVTEIEGIAFNDTQIKEFVVEEGSTAYKTMDGVLFTMDGTAIVAYPPMKEDTHYTIPEGVTTIPAALFAVGTTALTSVDIASTVNNIGISAFPAENLVEIKFLGDAPAFNEETFLWKTITAYYPEDNATWTEDVRGNYEGTVTWVPYSNELASGTLGDNLTWSLNKNGKLTISGIGAMADIAGTNNIPWLDYVDNITSVVLKEGITSIGNNIFSDCANMLTVSIPDSMTSIGDKAFYNCSNLTEITIPAGVTEIGVTPFYGCSNLTSIHVDADNASYTSEDGVLLSKDKSMLLLCPNKKSGSYTIPDEVTEIASNAFFGCINLTEVILGSNVLVIGSGAFRDCIFLKEMNITAPVTTIESHAFRDCKVLKKVIIGSDVTAIDATAFYGCDNLQEFEAAEDNESFASKDGMLFDKLMTTLVFVPAAKSGTLEVPDTVTAIGEYACFNCIALTSITLPNGLLTIGNNAFNGCTGITEISIPDSVTTLKSYAFRNCTGLTEVVIPNVVAEVGGGAFYGCKGLTKVTFGKSVSKIGMNVFMQDTELNTIIFLGDAPAFNSAAFRGITAEAYYPGDNATWTEDVLQDYRGSITWVPVIENKVIASGYSGYTTWELREDGTLTFSGEGAMKNYTYKSEMPWYSYLDQITNVVIEDGVTSIGSYAFYGMPSMTSIDIADTVTAIGDYAFKNATVLDNVVLPTALSSLGDSAFYSCTSLKAIEIPASLYTVKPYTFKNCTALANVTFHEGNLMKLSDGAFYGTALTEVTFPACLDIIDVYCFKNCTSLAKITIPEGDLTQVREAVFYGTAISTIEIPEGVTKVGPYAFKNCKKLISVGLPETLTSIGEASFYACTALESMDLPNAVTAIGNYAFRKCAAMKSVDFGDDSELTTIGESSFYGCVGLTALVIPNNVTTIQGYAFKSCTGLASIKLCSGLTTIGESAFHSCIGLEIIIIPKNVTSIGAYGFSGCIGLRVIEFTGDAPAIGDGAFNKVNVEACYPADNATWTDDVKKNYGGTISWNEK